MKTKINSLTCLKSSVSVVSRCRSFYSMARRLVTISTSKSSSPSFACSTLTRTQRLSSMKSNNKHVAKSRLMSASVPFRKSSPKRTSRRNRSKRLRLSSNPYPRSSSSFNPQSLSAGSSSTSLVAMRRQSFSKRPSQDTSLQKNLSRFSVTLRWRKHSF